MLLLAEVKTNQCKEIAKKVFTKSEELWNMGLEMGLKYPDTALTLNITSIEEIIKANILLYESLGANLKSIKGMDLFFKDHLAKYSVAFVLSVLGFFPEMLVHIFRDPDRKRIMKHLLLKKQMDKRIIKLFFKKFLQQIFNRAELYEKLFTIRNKGLYYEEIEIKPDERKFIFENLEKVHSYLKHLYQICINPVEIEDHELFSRVKSVLTKDENREMLEFCLSSFPTLKKKRKQLIEQFSSFLSKKKLDGLFENEDASLLFTSSPLQSATVGK